MQEDQRKQRNRDRLLEIDPEYRKAFTAVLERLESWGWRPRIQEAGRTDERQAELHALKRSETKHGGKHNRVDEEGNFKAWAADILNDNAPLDEHPNFYSDLAIAADMAGLQTGCYWGLPRRLREAVRRIVRLHDRDTLALVLTYKRGWDPNHVEVP